MFEETRLFEETIAPLAKQITEYIRDHQDDVAQEERWRTSMKRDISKNFRMQREASTTMAKEQRELVDSQFDKQREEMQAMQSKLNQLVERLANQRVVHIHAAC